MGVQFVVRWCCYSLKGMIRRLGSREPYKGARPVARSEVFFGPGQVWGLSDNEIRTDTRTRVVNPTKCS